MLGKINFARNNNKIEKEIDTNVSTKTIDLVSNIIEEAINKKASDIHIETYKDERVRLRLRVDGFLRPFLQLSVKECLGVVTRVKILAAMNIAETRLPQDGSFIFCGASEKIDIRVSSVPSLHGEKLVLRLLSANDYLRDVYGLGWGEKECYTALKLMRRQSGLLLAVGPTGCGKTTTLYSLLQQRNCDEVNIMTIEDPIEFDVYGFNQIQVNEKINLNFTTGLRSMLRQDPDIIMVGEIRDEETVSTAIRAALTGHLVVSTLHTNDALSTLIRLKDMGIPPYLLASALCGVISQRLIRNLCPTCKQAYSSDDKLEKLLGIKRGTTLYKAAGCKACEDIGYKSRFAVYEILEINESLQSAIHEDKKMVEIEKICRQTGYIPLSEGIRQVVLEGRTSASEALKILG